MTERPCLCGNDWDFQQDNGAGHNAHLTKDFFLRNNITLLDHPVCSPDLNPVDALCEAIFTTNVPTSLLETLASSMAKHIFEVINKNGGATHN